MTQFPFARGREYVCKNIGDYVQAVATRQFIDHIDEYIEQEEVNMYYPADGEKIRLVMNGWFQWRAKNWPPSEYILPLLISMHISPLKAQELLKPEGIAFLKKLPCRLPRPIHQELTRSSRNTCILFRLYDVDAWEELSSPRCRP